MISDGCPAITSAWNCAKEVFSSPMFDLQTSVSPAATDAHEAAQIPLSGVTEEYAVVPIELVDEPANPERETMDEHDLADLADSILAVGQQVPCRVKPKGERFEVIAGHRRLLACRIAQQPTLKVIVDRDSSVSDLAKMLAENTGREEPNPIERARVYRRALDEVCGGDIDALVQLVRRPRAHVEERLLLLAGDPAVVDALQQRRIGIGVAKELNLVQDDNRRIVLLDAAIRGGATVRTVMEWRIQANGQDALLVAADATVDGTTPTPAAPGVNGLKCFFCDSEEHTHLLELLYLHVTCKSLVMRLLNLQPAQPAGE